MAIARLLRSTTTRIALALLLVQLATVGLALLAMHMLTRNTIVSAAQDYALELQADISDQYDRTGPKGATVAISRRLASTGRRDAVIALRAPGGKVVAGNVGNWPPTIGPASPWRRTSLYRIGGARPEEMGVEAVALDDGYWLMTGQVLENENRLTEASALAFMSALAAGLLLAVAGSFAFARYIGRRVDHFALTAGDVAGGDLSSRVPVDGSGDAFDRLALSINRMLARIETLVTELRLVTDALAHDLRSPVARLKATVERALAGTRDPDALAALGSVAEEAEGLLQMLATALQISRAEAGIGRDQFETFDAAAMLADLAEVYGPLAEDEGFAIRLFAPGRLMVRAHREMLGQAIANLVDNALKYARGGSLIGLGLERRGQHVAIIVADNGAGIADEQRDEALRRFGRLDPARQAGGAGLGLSLVATIAHLHDGTMVLEDNGPGLRVRLDLPILVPTG